MIIYHQNQIQIIHYDKLIQVEPYHILIEHLNNKISIKGKDLKILLMNEEELMIQGELYAIEIL